MIAYLKKIMDLLPIFEKFKLTLIPYIENVHDNILSKLTSSEDFELLEVVPIEHLARLFISKEEKVILVFKDIFFFASHSCLMKNMSGLTYSFFSYWFARIQIVTTWRNQREYKYIWTRSIHWVAINKCVTRRDRLAITDLKDLFSMESL